MKSKWIQSLVLAAMCAGSVNAATLTVGTGTPVLHVATDLVINNLQNVSGSILTGIGNGFELLGSDEGEAIDPPAIIIGSPPEPQIITDGIIDPPSSFSNWITVYGDLYLDYSVFSTGNDLSINSNFSIQADSIHILGNSSGASLPSAYNRVEVGFHPLRMEGFGDWAIFAAAPLSDGFFQATGDIYIADFNSLTPAPVPVPASALFMASGLSAFFYMRRRNHALALRLDNSIA